MNHLLGFFASHVKVIAAFGWIIAVLISQMPAPMPNGSAFYKYVYAVLHTFAANADKFMPIWTELYKLMTTKNMLKSLAILALCFCSLSASAQTPTPSPTPAIQNFWAAGVSYNNGATPAVAGTGVYAHNVAGSATYAFTAIDALPTSTKPLTISTNMGVGIAQRVVTIKNIPIYIPTAAGISFTGSNTGWQWSTGGMAVIKVKGNFSIDPMIRVLKNNTGNGYVPVIGVLFGWGK